MPAVQPVRRGPSALQLGILVGAMLVTGASNSLWSKWQDMQCVGNCDDPNPSKHVLFEQPSYQTANMFLGETFCLLAFQFLASRLNPFRPATRASTAQAARKAAQAARLNNAPLSRPDESAIFFNESDISLHDGGNDYEDEEVGVKKGAEGHKEELTAWQKAVPFWAPAVCDICGTTAANVGLLFVPVSVYQMVRGCLVLWVGIFSVLFLKRKLVTAQWCALITVILGVAVVGASSVVGGGGNKEAESASAEGEKNPTVGIMLIVVGQLFGISMETHSVEPLLAVGYEGSFGLGTTIILMWIGHLYYGRTPAGRGGFADAAAGWHQMIDNPSVWGSSIAIAFSIAFFNFCGLAVTRSISATARSTIDTSRTCLIWLVSLFLGWEQFKWLQIIGFTLLVYGTFVFNGIARFPAWTGFHKDDIPSITLSEEPTGSGSEPEDDDDDDDDELQYGRSRAVDPVGRPVTRRSGSGRRGEISPLLKQPGQQ